jgi:hypothetical protein
MTFAEATIPTIANLNPPADANVAAWRADVRERALARAAPQSAWPRWLRIGVLIAALLLHVLLALWLRDLMRPQFTADRDRILVTLIDAPLAEPPLPEPPVAPARTVPSAPPRPARSDASAAAVRSIVRAQTRAPASATTATSAAVAPAVPDLRIYNTDGSLNVPKDLVEQIDAAQPKPNFIVQSVEPSPIMLPHRPLKIRPNYFANAWVHPLTETALDSSLLWLNNLMDKASATKEFETPWGDKVVCKWVLTMGGCLWGFPPPPGGRPKEPWKPATVLDEY